MKAGKVGALLLIFVVGYLGLAFTLGDRWPNETAAERLFLIAGTYIFGCTGVGLILPRHWYVAVFASWGPWLIGAIVLLPRRPIPDLGFASFTMVGIPLLALAAGYLGAQVRRFLGRKS